jgi:FkbM family methyltransferase
MQQKHAPTGPVPSDVELWRLAELIDDTPTCHGRMACFRNDSGALTQSLRAYGEWAAHEIAFCARFLAPGDTVLDVGGYIGTHALAFAHIVGPTGTVYSFEAQPSSFAVLAHNVATGQATQIRPVHAAVSDARTGPVILLDEIDIIAPRSYGSAAIGGGLSRYPQIPVPAATLDALGLASCALIKIDVEGMEDQVLSGAKHLLSSCAPLVYAECNTVDAGSRVAARLRESGYGVWMHLADAFNPHNWRGNPANIFGPSREAALVGVPARLHDCCQALRTGEHETFFEVRTLDDLAGGLLLKPQYPREVLHGTSAFRAAATHA